jgi:fatty-acyl-CoA synthase
MVPARRTVATIEDIRAVEEAGLSDFLPQSSPFEILEASARRYPDRPAIRYLRRVGAANDDVVLTYAQFLGRVRQAANLFRRLGVTERDSVAILAPHVLSTQIALWAAEVVGRVCPINPMLAPDHVIGLLKASGAKVAIALGDNKDIDIWTRLVPALRKSGCLTHILDCDSEAPTSGSDGNFDELIALENAEVLDFQISGGPDAVAAYFHTGGTTGAPKLAVHTRRNQAFVGRSAALMYDLGSDDVMVNGFPLFHVAGAFVYGLSVLAAGGSILIPTRLGMRNRAFVETIWQQVAHYGVTVIGGVPTVMTSLMAIPVNADIACMRMMLTGGSPLPTELADAFERTIGKPVRNILGMTECAGVITIEPAHGPRIPGSTGLPLPFTEVAAMRMAAGVFDPADRCVSDETGVIALRGPNVGPGYSDAKRNAGVFAQDWLVTGDLGHVDAQGRVFVTGRAKDVIIRGAHNIDPSIIEDALLQHPDVAIAAAVGEPDAYAGELPVVYVTLKPGAVTDAAAILAFVGPMMSEPAAVPKSVTILQEMPVTPIGKIYKPALRVLATRTALQRELARLIPAAGAAEADCSEAGNVIRLKNPTDEPRVRDALLGMPIQYRIEQM